MLTGTANLMITMFYMKDLNKPQILIPVLSESVKNVEVVGVWIFENRLLWKRPYCRLRDVAQPN